MLFKPSYALGLSLLIGSLFAQHSFAQSKKDPSPQNKADFEFVASVNGVAITQGLMDLNIRGLVSQGQKDTPQLRQAVKEELINKELIAQEASRLGLDKQVDFADQVMQLKLNLLLQIFVENHFQKEPITEDELREEYDRQRKLMGDSANPVQYRISQILLANETDALDLIRRLQKGELFGKLAQEYSIDTASKAQGGSLGWVLPGQMIPSVANVVSNLAKGGFTTIPVQTSAGWAILKLDDKRGFKIPTFENAKPQIRQALVQQYLGEVIKGLRTNARIIQ